MTTRNLAIACLGLTLGGLAACGSDSLSAGSDGPSLSEDGTSLTVVAEDIRFQEDTYQVQAGEVDVTYRNEGSVVHTLVIEDVDGFKLEVAGDGDEEEGSVDLQPGSYVLFCDIPGHREAGMEATLEVE